MHTPDDVTATSGSGSFSPHPEGQFPMVCVDVVDLGLKIEQFPGQPAREVPKVALVFVSGERQEDESLMLVTSEMTLSAGEKANLRKFLEHWRGKSYSDDQVRKGLPVTKLHSQAALVSVEHVLTRANRTFAKISAISPLPKQVPAPDAKLVTEYERPKFFADRKAAYAEAVKKFRAEAGVEASDPAVTDDADDDLPF